MDLNDNKSIMSLSLLLLLYVCHHLHVHSTCIDSFFTFEVVTPVHSTVDDSSPMAVEDNRDVLRKAVENIFNNLYGIVITLCILIMIGIVIITKRVCMF